MMDVNNLIKELRTSKIIAECPNTGEKFKLSETILFDGSSNKFPQEAEQICQDLSDIFKEELEELKKRKISAQEGAEQKAISSGVGKISEKILPAYSSFQIPSCDCRLLFEPIDMIIFNGLTHGKVESITFMEIKTGDSRLNTHQRLVKEAVVNKKIEYKEL